MKIPSHFTDTTDTTSKIWLAGWLFVWSPVFGKFIKKESVSIRPSETGRQAYERQTGATLATHDKIVFVDQ